MVGFTDGPREDTDLGTEADPGWGRKVAKTQGGILNRVKRKTLFRMWAVTGGSGCSHIWNPET